MHRMRGLPRLTSFAIVDVVLPKALLEWAGGEKAERRHQLGDSTPRNQPALMISEAQRERELRGRTLPPSPGPGEDRGTPGTPGPHRQSIVLKVLPRLFPGTPLLLTLPFQVPWREQLQVPVIGSWNPPTAAQEALGLWGVQEDFWTQKT